MGSIQPMPDCVPVFRSLQEASMDTGEVFQLLGGQLVMTLPSLVGWVAAMVVAVVLKRRNGGRATLFLLIGTGLMVVTILLRVPVAGLPALLVGQGLAAIDAAARLSVYLMVVESLKLGGIVCLVYAFWLQFHVSETLRRSP